MPAFGATGQHEPAGYLEGTLRGDGAADVARVALATGILDVQPDRVQLNGQILDVCVGQVSEGRNVSDRHRFLSSVGLLCRVPSVHRQRRTPNHRTRCGKPPTKA